jgi:hypothetical protein
MTRSIKLADLGINETSGVDHPAHLHEGWLVMKSTDLDTVLDEVSASPTNHGEGGHVDIEVESTPETVEVAAQDDFRKELTDLRKAYDDIKKEKAQIEAELVANQEAQELEKATERAHAWANVPGLDPSTFGAVLNGLRKSAPEAAETVEAILDATSIAMTEAGILKEVGNDSTPDTGDAWAIIEARANDLVANGQASDFAKAVSTIAVADRDLYNRYLNEKGF